MDQKSDQVANVRLKIFMARQFDRRPGQRVAWSPTGQQVAILASISLMKRYAGRSMNESAIGNLFAPRLSPSQLTAVLSKLQAAGLVRLEAHTAAGKFYAATSDGLDRLAEFVDRMLGTPAGVEAELRSDDKYRELIEHVNELIDRHLLRVFTEAAKGNKRTLKPRGARTTPVSRSDSGGDTGH